MINWDHIRVRTSGRLCGARTTSHRDLRLCTRRAVSFPVCLLMHQAIKPGGGTLPDAQATQRTQTEFRRPADENARRT